ncbi:MAG: transporter substrate-binding domain-containing protein [Flavobacteriales bacterium]|nr:transporter substrate-binding domain-containing protein [Flavobacteriales bacterium]
MTLRYIILCTLVALLVCCESNRNNSKTNLIDAPAEKVLADLEEITAKGKLVVLTENSSVSYYLYKGQPMGYDYEMLKKFAESINVELEIKVIEDLNQMFEALDKGEGDIIACNLTVTEERKEYIAFSEPLMQTRQVLVQKKPEKWWNLTKSDISDSLVDQFSELANKEIYVHDYSVFASRLKELDTLDNPIQMLSASGKLDSEKLIRLVAEGDIESTVADENMALLNQAYFPHLDVSFSISDVTPIAWGVRKSSVNLLEALNNWIEQPPTQRKLNFAHKKYFDARRDQKKRVESPYSSFAEGRISPYDEVLQMEGDRIQWDWKLIAAVIYEESRFNPNAKSWAGAFGLMQLMPKTAERFGIDTTQTEAANIRAGVSYLKYLDRFWKDKVTDPNERTKFILASYNVGPGHVLDAQKIAKKLNMNPLVWEGNVADCLLLKSQKEYATLDVVKHGYCRGEEAYEYVKKVWKRYQHYQLLEA